MSLLLHIIEWAFIRIGIIFLIILGIVFLLSLFSITYEINANKNVKSLKSYVDIKYLFGLIKFRGIFDSSKKDDKKLACGLKVLFFTIKNNDKKEKAVKYKEEYNSDSEKENLDYIFNDKDDFLDSDTKNKLAMVMALNKKTKYISTIKNKNDKTEKKSIFAKIFGLLKEKRHKTLKEIFAIIKEIINLIKPKKTKIKFTFTTFKIDIEGKIRIINLIFIAIKVLLKKKIRELVFK